MITRLIVTVLLLTAVRCANAQVGINTTTPHSTLHVKGSVAASYHSFSGDATAGATDNILVFTAALLLLT